MELLAIGFIAIGNAIIAGIAKFWFRPRRSKPTITEQLDARRLADPLFAVRNPESAELREIYRDLDEAIGITDPDLVTPPSPTVVGPQIFGEGTNIFMGVGLDPGEYVQRLADLNRPIGKFPPAGKPDKPERKVSFQEMADILRKQGKDLSQH